jgi:hypothetical protein
MKAVAAGRHRAHGAVDRNAAQVNHPAITVQSASRRDLEPP